MEFFASNALLRRWLTIVACAWVVSLTPLADAARVVSVNLYAGNTRNIMFPADAAGAPGVRVTNWNQLTASQLSLGPNALVDSFGVVASNLTVTLNPAGSFLDRAAGVTNDNKMLATVIDKFEGGPGGLSVSNVPYAVYNVYVYHRPDYPTPGDGLTKTRGGYFTLTNATGQVQRRYISTQDRVTGVGLPATVNADGSGYVLAQTTNIALTGSFAQIEGGHYVKFHWLTNAGFTMLMSALGGGAADDAGNVITDGDTARRLKWCGFQIEEVPYGVATNLSLVAPVPTLLAGDPVASPVAVLAQFANGTSANVSTYPGIEFASANSSVFTVSSGGQLLAQGGGVANLIVQYQSLSLTQAVTVLAPTSLVPPTVVASNLFVGPGGGGNTSARLVANFFGQPAVDVSSFRGVTFSGGPVGVVTVQSNGTVTATGAGNFFLIGDFAGLSATNPMAGTVVMATNQTLKLTSPNGRLELEFAVTNFDGAVSCPVYQVRYDGDLIVTPSRLGVTFNGAVWRENVLLGAWSTNRHDITWQPVHGERSSVRDHYQELIVELVETTAPGRVLQVAFRAYDEGVAFSYVFPGTTGGLTNLTEQTEFCFGADHKAWSVTSAQGVYTQVNLSTLPNACERPLVLELTANRYVALAEARLVNFARMKFNRLGVANGLVTALHSAVNSTGPLTSPWRVIMAAASPGGLLENNHLIQNLNTPCEIADPSWIKPGKVIREVTLSTTGGVACVDFAVKHRLQFIEYDAGWYGPEGATTTATSVDPARNLDLQFVINYAASNGVGVILYVNKLALANQIDILPALYRSWGVKGIKFGFVNVGSQADTAWLHEAIRKCATNQIMVDIHDEYRVTGYERTYPNLMTVEGIGGDETTPAATQTLNILFTRMIAGAADHTFCYFDNRVKNNWTHAYQLAKAVCFYSPWQFLYWYDRPTNSVGYVSGAANSITDEPDLSFWDALPTVWDETRVLRGSIGEFAVIARRSGADWFLGALNAGVTRNFSTPLDFLATNTMYYPTRYSHAPAATNRTKVQIESQFVTATNLVALELSPANGEAWRFLAVTPPEFSGISVEAGGMIGLTAFGREELPFTLWRRSVNDPRSEGWSAFTNGIWTANPLLLMVPPTTNSGGELYRLSIP
jgi:alpha-glucosidase